MFLKCTRHKIDTNKMFELEGQRSRDVNKARGVKANKPRPETYKAKATDPRPRMRT